MKKLIIKLMAVPLVTLLTGLNLWADGSIGRIAVFNTSGKLKKCELAVFNPTSLPQKISNLNAKIYRDGVVRVMKVQVQTPSSTFVEMPPSMTLSSQQAIRILFDFFDFNQVVLIDTQPSFAFAGSFRVEDDTISGAAKGAVVSTMECFRKDGFQLSGSYLIPIMGGMPF